MTEDEVVDTVKDHITSLFPRHPTELQAPSLARLDTCNALCNHREDERLGIRAGESGGAFFDSYYPKTVIAPLEMKV